MTIIAYLRGSTSEQADAGAGLEAQRAAIAAEAARRAWTDVQYVEDAGFSAKSMKRPGLMSALARLREGHADVLVVSKTDRLSRSVLDFASIMQTAQREGWGLVALDSPADLTTPAGEAMAGVMAVFAQLERKLIGQRTADALAAKRAAGVRLGRPRSIAPGTEARVLDLRADGLTFRAIAERLDAEGPAPPGGGVWRPSTLARVVDRAAPATRNLPSEKAGLAREGAEAA
jgi:DNA invertase Pin-like site-specific DNA recombinase